jgi:hypothetical protein
VARPRLCAPLPPLPAVEDVELSRHAVERFIRRCWRVRETVRFADAEQALRELLLAGEVVRRRPDGFGGQYGRFDRTETIAYVLCEGGDQPFALPVTVSQGRPVAVTTLLRVA